MSAPRALLLDGRRDDEPTIVAAHDALVDGLAACGWAVDDWLLRDETIADCMGCFGCWIKTPGMCVSRGAGRTVAERIMRSDLQICLTPVTFGGYSSELKKALDHLIPVLLPHFRAAAGDTRHKMRYDVYPNLLTVGVMPAGAPGAREDAQVFRALAARIALNRVPERWAAGVIDAGSGDWEIRVTVAELLSQVGVSIREEVAS